MEKFKKVLVTGGAGYVGAVLVPKLLKEGFEVSVLDLFIFGDHVLDSCKDDPKLTIVKGDMRDPAVVRHAIKNCDAVIHLACISNDPSFELNPNLGKSINFDCFPDLINASKEVGVKRFIYASSSSVYGVKADPDVHEGLPLEPLTDYSKYKALCEDIILKAREPGFVTLVLRPATVCGYSPRMRLDLTVNILTHLAIIDRKITVFGGDQMRPNIHIEDVTDLYVKSLRWDDELIDGKIFNAGYDNRTVKDIASMVQGIVSQKLNAPVEITTQTSNDNRSYHVSSEKIRKELGFVPSRTIEQASIDVMNAFLEGAISNSKEEVRYYNIKTMQNLHLE